MTASANNGLKAFQLGEDVAAHLDVKLNTTDGKVYMAGANDDILGTTERGGDNGDYVTIRMKNMSGTRLHTVASSCARGALLYGAASGQVDDVAGGAPRYVALQAASGANSVIEVAPCEKSGLVKSGIADSSNVTNTVTETDFDVQQTINLAGLKVGDVLRIRGQAFCTQTHSTDTLAIKLYLGALALLATTATDVADSDVVTFEATVTVTVAGASGKVRAMGSFAVGASGTGALKHIRKAETAVDLSGTGAIKASATWSAADATNIVKLEQLVAELVPARAA